MLRAQKTFSESAKRFYGFFRESPGNLIFRDGSGFFKNQFFAVCAAQGKLFSVQLKMLDRRQKLQIFLLCGHQLLRTGHHGCSGRAESYFIAVQRVRTEIIVNCRFSEKTVFLSVEAERNFRICRSILQFIFLTDETVRSFGRAGGKQQSALNQAKQFRHEKSPLINNVLF